MSVLSPLINGIRKAGHTRWFARITPLYVPIDRALGRISTGRLVTMGNHEIGRAHV